MISAPRRSRGAHRRITTQHLKWLNRSDMVAVYSEKCGGARRWVGPASNAKGVEQQSPGLSRGYEALPWVNVLKQTNPNGVADLRAKIFVALKSEDTTPLGLMI